MAVDVSPDKLESLPLNAIDDLVDVALDTNDDLSEMRPEVTDNLWRDGKDGLPEGTRVNLPRGSNVRSCDDLTDPMRGKESLLGLARRTRSAGAREYLPGGVATGDIVALC